MHKHNAQRQRHSARPFIVFMLIAYSPPEARGQEAANRDGPKIAAHYLDAKTPEGLRQLLKYTGERLPLVSGHRGGAGPGLPENCIATFENTLKHTYALLEIDPRYVKDGAIVVHHDPRLERTTTGKGLLTEHTLEELKALRLKDTAGNVTGYQIPTLDEVLEWARGKAILVLDQKDVPVAARVKKIEEHRAEAYAMLIVYSYKEARECYDLNPDIMMEVMVPSREKVAEFDRLGVPWSNVIAFVGHQPPQDTELFAEIHQRGALCLLGTSRHLDRELLTGKVTDVQDLQPRYAEFLQRGTDVFETDIPALLGAALFRETAPPEAKKAFFGLR